VDALKVDPEQKITAWGKATVKSKVSAEKILVTFENDCRLSDRELNIYSPELAVLGTHSTKENEWRSALEPDDRVDCFDSTGSWYACTVQ